MDQLKKSLSLLDVIAICVGAMFSSGFFLLPGLAYAHTGPSVFLAYVMSGFLIIPSMLSQAELCTAMPKAGGTYFFLDRAFGPVIGTIGGLGTFLGLVLKTAFAMIGFGAYLQLYADVSIQHVAAGLAVTFIILNLIGAKESGRFQKVLVALLLVAMSFFIVEGLRTITHLRPAIFMDRFSNFFAGGVSEFFYSIAFVFVSYAGLTKVASVAEEIENPEVNIPLGMIISLVITTLIYGLGVFVVVGLVPGVDLMQDLKPIATAEKYAFDWLRGPFSIILVAAAALAAFASTGNAGVLASSRYPLAMSKDKLIPKVFSKINKLGVPAVSVLFTGFLIVVIIYTQSEEGIAKFASAFQLLLFIMINTAVIVMRQSKITTYDPGYKSPFYPWLQLSGIVICFGLLIYMGTWLLLSLLCMMIVFSGWYYFYASGRVDRRGAIFHWFANLGKNQFQDLEGELWDIMKVKGVRKEDPVNQIVSDAHVIRLEGKQRFEEVVTFAAAYLSKQVNADQKELVMGFNQKSQLGAMPISGDLCMAGLRLVGLESIKLVVVCCPDSFSVKLKDVHGDVYERQNGRLALFLLSPERQVHSHLRLMANWVNQAENHGLVAKCLSADSPDTVREALSLTVRKQVILLTEESKYKEWIGQVVGSIEIPPRTSLDTILRKGKAIEPGPEFMLKSGDQVVLVLLDQQESE